LGRFLGGFHTSGNKVQILWIMKNFFFTGGTSGKLYPEGYPTFWVPWKGRRRYIGIGYYGSFGTEGLRGGLQKEREAAIDAFIDACAPLLASFIHSLPPPLQVLNVTSAAVIVAARLFWLYPGGTFVKDVGASLELYVQSGAAYQVNLELLEAFQGAVGWYNTPVHKAAVLQVILNNQMSSEDTTNLPDPTTTQAGLLNSV